MTDRDKIDSLIDHLKDALQEAKALKFDKHFISDLSHLVSTAEYNKTDYVPATVQNLIDFLEKTFGREDKLCYWHEGGAWMECEPVFKSDLGRSFLKHVQQAMDERVRSLSEYDSETFKKDYRMVKKEDVIIY